MTDSYRILVADDNVANQTVIKGMLEHVGYRVDIVQNGSEAIQALEARHYDLVVMDCLMPVLDGFAATRRIRNSNSTRFDAQIPILATTALTAVEDRDSCFAAGMTDYISKPIDANSLFALVSSCLTGSHDPKNRDQLLPNERAAKSSPVDFSDSQARVLSSISDIVLADAGFWQEELKDLGKARKLDKLGRLAHKIRGSAEIIGEPRLSELAEQLEQSCKLEHENQSLKLTSLLSKELKILVRKRQSAD